MRCGEGGGQPTSPAERILPRKETPMLFWIVVVVIDATLPKRSYQRVQAVRPLVVVVVVVV